MKASLHDLLAKIPGRKTAAWPEGEPFVEALRHGSMSVEVFAPRGVDSQKPHDQDELYFVISGTADFHHEGERTRVSSGDALFVPATERHHFEGMTADFATWVVFWGPMGGER
jgi:mannose-6-phosphate isomerase-like protein (cupin superfamily)